LFFSTLKYRIINFCFMVFLRALSDPASIKRWVLQLACKPQWVRWCMALQLTVKTCLHLLWKWLKRQEGESSIKIIWILLKLFRRENMMS
jgi:hypothetical protein